MKRLLKKKLPRVDYQLLIVSGLLLAAGLIMMNSISVPQSLRNFGNTTHYISHQALFGAGFGLIVLLFCSRIDYRRWQKWLPLVVVVSLGLLILVKVPGLGFGAGGATRWIRLGPIFFQPAELAKLAMVLYTAGWLTRQTRAIKDFYYDILPALVIIGLFALLILWQPDVGTMAAAVITTLVMLFAGGVPRKYLAGILGFGGVAFLFLILIEPYRLQRLTTFLNRSADPLGKGYQISQAILGIGSGQLFGYGYSGSRQKWNYLPESIGDSVFAVIAEELGFIGVMIILGLFLWLAQRGLRLSLRAPDSFGRLLALGITASILVQVIINVGAIIGIFPLTGITLPFFSYGSSSLIVTLAEIGILLNISRYAH